MKKLIWDTGFWGKNIYSFENNDSYNELEITEDNALIQTYVNSKESNRIIELQNMGFRTYETKVKLVYKVKDTEFEINNNFKMIEMLDILDRDKDFYDLFGSNSRFKLFSKSLVNNFYFSWIKNSIIGQLDDFVIGYYKDSKICGFITYRIKAPDLIIGLVGVFPEYQSQGIASSLLKYVKKHASILGVEQIYVSTQCTNINAINLYIKNEFVVSEIGHWLYYLK